MANISPIKFDPGLLAEALKKSCPEVVFALIMGSSVGGLILPGSDLDVAVYLDCKPAPVIFLSIIEAIELGVPGAKVDLGILNGNEPVYRFEALKGRLLYTLDQETWLHFFSLTCREYEHWMAHYEKQRRYRLEIGPRR